MPQLHVAAFISLDGVIQAPGGEGEDPSGGFDLEGWNPPYWDDAAGEAVGSLFAGDVALLLGRKTYDIFAGHWPRQDGAFADALNAMPKFVATRSPGPLDWTNSRAIGPDVAQAVRDLKARPGPDLLTQGSAELVRSLFEADLVDRLTLLTFPVVLGRGKRLFGEASAPFGLKLTDSRTTSTGVVVAAYEREGPVRTGSFDPEGPA